MPMITDKPGAIAEQIRTEGPSMEDRFKQWRPEFDSLLGPGGQLREGFGAGFGRKGMEAQTALATAEPGTSPWEQMIMKRQGTEEAGQRDMAQRQGAQFGRDVWNRMAMRGGAGAGSRERAAIQGQRQMGAGMQDVARGGTMARQDIGLGAEKMRMGLLGDVARREQMGAMGDQGFKFGEIGQQRGFDMQKFQEQMAGEAARKQATAIEQSGK